MATCFSTAALGLWCLGGKIRSVRHLGTHTHTECDTERLINRSQWKWAWWQNSTENKQIRVAFDCVYSTVSKAQHLKWAIFYLMSLHLLSFNISIMSNDKFEGRVATWVQQVRSLSENNYVHKIWFSANRLIYRDGNILKDQLKSLGDQTFAFWIKCTFIWSTFYESHYILSMWHLW